MLPAALTQCEVFADATGSCCFFVAKDSVNPARYLSVIFFFSFVVKHALFLLQKTCFLLKKTHLQHLLEKPIVMVLYNVAVRTRLERAPSVASRGRWFFPAAVQTIGAMRSRG